MSGDSSPNDVPDEPPVLREFLEHARQMEMEPERLAKSNFSERLSALFSKMVGAIAMMVAVSTMAVVSFYVIGPRALVISPNDLNANIPQLSSAKKTLDILVDLSSNEKSASPDIHRLIQLAQKDVDASLKTLKNLSETSSWASLEGLNPILKANAQELKTTAKEAVEPGLIPKGMVRTYLSCSSSASLPSRFWDAS